MFFTRSPQFFPNPSLKVQIFKKGARAGATAPSGAVGPGGLNACPFLNICANPFDSFFYIYILVNLTYVESIEP